MARLASLLALLAVLLLMPGFSQGQDEKAKYYRIVSLDSGKVIDVTDSSTENGAKIVINTKSDDSESQQWKMVKAGDYVKLVNRKSGRVLDVPNLSKEEGIDMIQWDDNGGENQQWTMEKPDKEKSDKGVFIKSRLSELVLDVAEAATADGSRVIQWGYHGGKNQLWEVEEVKK
jgi:hypothetical protein